MSGAAGAGVLFAVVAVAVGLVVGFGRPPGVPAFTSLRAHPDPAIPGSIAFVGGSRERACVYVTAASGAGTPRPLLCQRNLFLALEAVGGGDVVTWNQAGHVVVDMSTERGLQRVEYDTDGRVVQRTPLPGWPPGKPALDRWRRASDGATLSADRDRSGRTLLVLQPKAGPARTILSVRAPSDYWFSDAVWSPDGRYAAFTDGEGRLLVVDVDSARPTARVMATAAEYPAWSTTG